MVCLDVSRKYDRILSLNTRVQSCPLGERDGNRLGRVTGLVVQWLCLELYIVTSALTGQSLPVCLIVRRQQRDQ